MRNVKNLKVLNIGVAGTGKTTLMKKYLCMTFKRNYNIILAFPFELFIPINLYTYTDDTDTVLSLLYLIYNSRDNYSETPLYLFIDEIDIYNQNDERLHKIIKFARNKNISVFATAKRIQDVSKKILSQFTYLNIFRHTIHRDLSILSNYIDNVDLIKKLNDFEFIRLNLQTNEYNIYELRPNFRILNNCLKKLEILKFKGMK